MFNHIKKEGKLMQKVKATIRIENVVASATLNQKVDLNAVVKGYPGVEYRPEQFPGLVFRLKRPKTATLIFNSGKMVCTGAKSEKESLFRCLVISPYSSSLGISAVISSHAEPGITLSTAFTMRGFLKSI